MTQHEWSRLFQITSTKLKDNWSLELDENLVHNSQRPGWKKCIVSTGGRFRCTKCGRGWSSNMVRVVCHMRLASGQGFVKLRPSRQNCKECTDGPMEEPSISSDNIKTLLKNVVEKIRIKCYNEYMGNTNRPFRSFDTNRPHEPAHCEACMQGICPKR
ncbi:receptor-transporting protein 3-like [Plectropomus leopardus]|uniref:receptor-transporting protein 3-like n=1 Tax=Plectropomus leopardus TaxID=160734 RepID=UPI001C4DD21C|nr:receptor-transporting protein 3-like [Plectropomus leopardus]